MSDPLLIGDDEVTTETTLARHETPQNATSPLALLQSAIEQGATAETLERLVGLHERMERNADQKVFGSALAAFQQELRPIHKGRKADRFQYAGFDDIMREVGPLLAKNGISVGFDTTHGDKVLEVTARIRVGSYHEDRKFTVPIPASLKVSEPQQYGAALSYAKRYCLCAALNIVVTDEDNEDTLQGNAEATAEQIAEIKALLDETDADRDKFFAWLGVPSLSQMTQRDYIKAKRGIQAKAKKP